MQNQPLSAGFPMYCVTWRNFQHEGSTGTRVTMVGIRKWLSLSLDGARRTGGGTKTPQLLLDKGSAGQLAVAGKNT